MTWTAAVAPLRRWMTGWPDPPWSMTGRTVTLWFETPTALAFELLGERLVDPDHTRPSRLRFYDVEFAGRSGDSWQEHSMTGRFREAVVALPARCAQVTGEVSTFMWTESETYLTWGRELFGWPLGLSDIDLTGPLWDGSGDQGQAVMGSGAGRAALTVLGRAATTSPSPLAPPVWLTPKRVLDLASDGQERVEITAVVPEIVRPGVRIAVEAQGELTFTEGHPLHGISMRPVHAEVHHDFELVVGSNVSVVASWAP
jgi:hypothetical protein